MKFCKHCGNQIPDNAVCNCPGAVAERQAQGGYQQPAYQQPAYAAPQPRQGKSFGQKLIDPFKVYFKNPKKAVDNRIADKDFITPLIYIGALFIIMLGVKSCIYGTEAVKGRPFVNYNFGLDLLAAFIATIALCAVFVLSRFIILAVCGKKPFRGGQVLLESLISFGVNSMVPMCIMLVGGLFYMATSMIAIMFFTLAAVWYIAAGLLEIKDAFDPNGNPFVRLLIVAVVIGVFIALYILLYSGLFAMNVRSVTASASTSLSDWRSLLGY